MNEYPARRRAAITNRPYSDMANPAKNCRSVAVFETGGKYGVACLDRIE